MKKRSAYILLFLFVLHNSAFNQLLKVPALLNHYVYHHQLNRNISFTTFLTIHYTVADDGDNDQEQDRQLPYKQIDGHLLQQTFIPLAKVVSIRIQEMYQPVTINYPVLKDQYLPAPALNSLFRPPRTV
ncbi:hypothetical protein ACDQ55_09005 [Chitinophaga sp. 30R24]|uniref:hypothetical protein n=1 Tax=Chitinophaga sp. 30R24 TaxID=3248838 RepID=UPI003B918AB2